MTEKLRSMLPFASFLLTAGGLAALFTYLAGGSLRKVLGAAGFTVLILFIGLLKSRYRQIDRAIETFFSKYFRFTFWLIVTLAPVVFFNWLSRLALESAPVFQVILLLLWGGLLTGVLILISTARRREKLFQFLERVGALAPFVYCLNAFVIAALFFATLTFLLTDFGWLSFTNPDGGGIATSELSVDRFMEFFIWHFLDAVPLLKINQTLRWQMQLSYTSAAAGLMVLLFKITVIIPVISAFRAHWKHRQAAKKRVEQSSGG